MPAVRKLCRGQSAAPEARVSRASMSRQSRHWSRGSHGLPPCRMHQRRHDQDRRAGTVRRRRHDASSCRQHSTGVTTHRRAGLETTLAGRHGHGAVLPWWICQEMSWGSREMVSWVAGILCRGEPHAGSEGSDFPYSVSWKDSASRTSRHGIPPVQGVAKCRGSRRSRRAGLGGLYWVARDLGGYRHGLPPCWHVDFAMR